MDLTNIIWNIDNYNKFINYLFSIKDETYSNFTFKLLKNDQIKIIGIRIPILKKMAKMISKTNYLEFIKLNKHEYLEEILLHGLVITYLNDFLEAITLFNKYIKYIDNWSSCDTVVANFKLFKKNLNAGFIYINKYLNNKNPWINRVGIVLLLDYYINDLYINEILNICDNITSDNYYVKMANAWLISMCLVKYYDKTYNFLLNNNLDNFTYNKTIQKALESYRIKSKDELRKLKRQIK
jgi:3-methyladenine DNA glycosylase AlkD